MCAKVSDDDVAKAFGVTGWHGRDVKGPGHDPSDVSCLFKGEGYEFTARTTVVSGSSRSPRTSWPSCSKVTARAGQPG
jgi:hypothetical protein